MGFEQDNSLGPSEEARLIERLRGSYPVGSSGDFKETLRAAFLGGFAKDRAAAQKRDSGDDIQSRASEGIRRTTLSREAAPSGQGPPLHQELPVEHESYTPEDQALEARLKASARPTAGADEASSGLRSVGQTRKRERAAAAEADGPSAQFRERVRRCFLSGDFRGLQRQLARSAGERQISRFAAKSVGVPGFLDVPAGSLRTIGAGNGRKGQGRRGQDRMDSEGGRDSESPRLRSEGRRWLPIAAVAAALVLAISLWSKWGGSVPQGTDATDAPLVADADQRNTENQGGAVQGRTEQGSTEQGRTEQGGTEQGGTEQGGVVQGDSTPLSPEWRLELREGDGLLSVNGGAELVSLERYMGDTAAFLGAGLIDVRSSRIELVLPGELVVELRPGAVVDLGELQGSAGGSRRQIQLEQGELLVHKAKASSDHVPLVERLLIKTMDADVEVLGTVLGVLCNEMYTCVCVLQGQVEVTDQGGQPRQTPSRESRVIRRDRAAASASIKFPADLCSNSASDSHGIHHVCALVDFGQRSKF